VELTELARRVLLSEDLAAKLCPAGRDLTDLEPGPAVRHEAPGRPENLRIRPAREVKVPAVAGFGDPAQRVRLLHALANHELQAAELFAWALLAFPEAPADFRRDLAKILDDEQRHTRMYAARVEAHGAQLGDFPVSGYFWGKVPTIHTPLQFIAAMSLTFENANLDHTAENAEAARRGGDEKTARVIEQVAADEVEHVAFGWRWLQVWKQPGESSWDAWRRSLTWPLRPVKAKGSRFERQGREAAGLDADFIARLEASDS
jgi:uncharacterized ferritin-like protein (DUF455 family)